MNEIAVMGQAIEKYPTVGWILKGSKATTEYALEYMHNGRKWCMDFFAKDEADAEKKS